MVMGRRLLTLLGVHCLRFSERPGPHVFNIKNESAPNSGWSPKGALIRDTLKHSIPQFANFSGAFHVGT